KKNGSELKSVIAAAGRTPPDWYDATPLDYPQSLDLTWPQKPPGGWNNQKNVGQYIWDIINPNPGRWRSGVRFMHYMLSVHKDDPAMSQRIMNELGRMYCELLQDYARAAFWYEQARVGKGSPFDGGKSGAHLAECYWRLGNRKTAVDLMNKLPLTFSLIKLWGDIGDTDKCVQLAAGSIGSARFPAMHYLVIGDAYRVAGDYPKAMSAYQKALDAAGKSSEKQDAKFKQRAQSNMAGLQLLAGIDLKNVRDGAYRASSVGYEGPVEVEVRVDGSRIEEVRVTQHHEKQFYSSITDMPAKIVEKQGFKGVDATSGATLTSEAIINASAKALADGTK
ncbi:MAG: FMN-binding protein, partial [Planctomycetales bacterium]|nr:FMN-binding protein [Planctomycetales bacterium]